MSYIIRLFLVYLTVICMIAHADDSEIYTPRQLAVNDKIKQIYAQDPDLGRKIGAENLSRQYIRGNTIQGGSRIDVGVNYPVVPYDPNHPNVTKTAQRSLNLRARAGVLAGNLAKGANYALLAMAVVDILGEGVDWVLDPDNNSIVYTSNNLTAYKSVDGKIFQTLEAAADHNCSRADSCLSVKDIKWEEHNNWWRVYTNTERGTGLAWTVTKSGNQGNLDLETVANHIINNNITNNYYDRAVVNTIDQQISNGDHDTEITNAIRSLADEVSANTSDNNQPDVGSDTKTDDCARGYKTGENGECLPETGETGDGSNNNDDQKSEFKLPDFCKWASWFCDGDVEKPDGEVDIEEVKIPTNSVNINLRAQCPSGSSFDFMIGGRQMTFTMSYDNLCKIANAFGGIVKVLATIVAAYILTGIRS